MKTKLTYMGEVGVCGKTPAVPSVTFGLYEQRLLHRVGVVDL